MTHKYLSMLLPQSEARIRPDDCTEIDANLFIGNYNVANDFFLLKSLGITFLIAVYSKNTAFYQIIPRDCRYHQIKAFDVPHEDLISYFDRCHHIIETELSADNGKVLVYCGAGFSRSASIVCAYLMKKYAISAEEALSRVQQKRSKVNPNPGFVAQLGLYGDMKCKLDVTNMEYRLFIIINLRMKMLAEAYWESEQRTRIAKTYCEPMKLYLDKMDESAMPATAVSYRCRKCKHVVFSDSDVITNDGPLSTDECPLIFVSPIKWMIPHITYQKDGEIKCFNCLNILGVFDWNSYDCQCNRHNYMQESRVFKIDKTNVTKDNE